MDEMTRKNQFQIAQEAEMILDGYAFTKKEGGVQVVNLANLEKVVFLSNDGEVLESTMPGIEEVLVQKYFRENREFLFEEEDAEIL